MRAIDVGFSLLKNDDLDDIAPENKGGDCYYNSFNYMCANPNHTLVHAQVTPLMGPLAGRPYGHAFTTFMGEDGKKMVHDPSADGGKGMTMPADMYYALGQIRAPNMVEYTQEDMMRHIQDTMHAGPWDPMAEQWMHSSDEDRQKRKEMDGEVLDDGEEWDDDDDMIQNALDPMSINPLLQTAEGMMNQGVTQDMPQSFQDQEGRFVIQPELRLDPITATKVFGQDPLYGHPQATRDFLAEQGATHNGVVPVPMDMVPPHGILSGRKPTEWQDLTIRPVFGDMKNIPGKQNETYQIPSQVREIAMGKRGRLRGGELEVKRPYFGDRTWPHTKGLEGMGWFPREGSAGQLTWIEGMEHVRPLNAPMVEDLVVDPAFRRQGLGTDLVDNYRYSLPALFPKAPDLKRSPAETYTARDFWDKYFQARWDNSDDFIPMGVNDASFQPMMDIDSVRLRPGQRIPPIEGGVLDTGPPGIPMLEMVPGLSNTPDMGTPKPLAPLPSENRFVQALQKPNSLLATLQNQQEPLTWSDRMNRRLAKLVGKGGRRWKDLAQNYPYME